MQPVDTIPSYRGEGCITRQQSLHHASTVTASRVTSHCITRQQSLHHASTMTASRINSHCITRQQSLHHASTVTASRVNSHCITRHSMYAVCGRNCSTVDPMTTTRTVTQ
ncbi:hypothetical protein ACOMHN_067298 [Nucella lapillus]